MFLVVEETGNIKWAEMEIDGKTQYVICNLGGFGTTTNPPNNAPVVNYKGQTVDEAEFGPNGYYDIPYSGKDFLPYVFLWHLWKVFLLFPEAP